VNNTPIQLIVGLANPGKEYAETRHNAGAWFIEQLAQHAQARLRMESKYHGLHCSVELHHRSCQLLIPTTFMNHSGQAVHACMRYHKIAPEALLIAHDDIDLPVGTIKLKFDGGDGGHNGLKDLIRHLNTRQFYRLRIGVGRPQLSHEVIDYVLHPPSKADRQKINAAIDQAQAILPLVMAGEMQKAMQQLHTQALDG
jgi:PTH1 family peptidyl-tRNA hydrolase